MEMGSALQTRKIFYNRRKIAEFIVDETQIKISKDYFWIWVALESDNKKELFNTSKIEQRISMIIFHVVRTNVNFDVEDLFNLEKMVFAVEIALAKASPCPVKRTQFICAGCGVCWSCH